MAGLGITDNSGDVNGVAVNISHQLAIVPEVDAADHPENVGGVRMFGENDTGAITGAPQLASPETDQDYRQRQAADTPLDEEIFNYAAQNTGKHTFVNSTMAGAWGANSFTTNSGGSVTVNQGLTFGTYKEFPIIGTHTLSLDIEASFSAAPTTNTIIDFGLFRRGAATAYAPADGAFFRLTSAGLSAVISNNGSETIVGPFPVDKDHPSTPWAYSLNEKYQFIIYVSPRVCEFWINDNGNINLFATINTPNGLGQPVAGATLPFSVRHAIIGGNASGAISMNVCRYNVRLGGSNITDTLGTVNNRMFGAYEGLSGGTPGALISGTVTTGTLVAPSAAVPLNASLAANLCNSLGVRSYETFTTGLALDTDGILQQYQVPAGSVSVAGRRLRLNGVKLSAWIQTVMAGGTAIINEFKLGFGNSATSLQTAEAAATKKPRYVLLPELTQAVALTQAVSTQVAQPGGMVCNFQNPIYVEPGQFMELIITHKGTTIPTSGVIAYDIQFDYSWE